MPGVEAKCKQKGHPLVGNAPIQSFFMMDSEYTNNAKKKKQHLIKKKNEPPGRLHQFARSSVMATLPHKQRPVKLL